LVRLPVLRASHRCKARREKRNDHSSVNRFHRSSSPRKLGLRLNMPEFTRPPGTWRQRVGWLSEVLLTARSQCSVGLWALRSALQHRGGNHRVAAAGKPNCRSCVDPSLSFARFVQERTSLVQEGSFRWQMGQYVFDIWSSLLALCSRPT
jgi:hypothetical protein